jgi:hypothetical protein
MRNIAPRDASELEAIEQREWLESLDYVIQQGDRGRVQRLLTTLRQRARTAGVAPPFTAVTPYVNTLRPDEETPLPGSQEIERRLKSLVRWNAKAMVVRANRLSAAESDAYFATRDPGSRLGAWGSDQSRPIESREALISQIRERATGLGLTPDGTPTGEAGTRPVIRRPPHWGGYRIWADVIELWLEGRNRVHDRAAWRREITRTDDHSFRVAPWAGTRLQP